MKYINKVEKSKDPWTKTNSSDLLLILSIFMLTLYSVWIVSILFVSIILVSSPSYPFIDTNIGFVLISWCITRRADTFLFGLGHLKSESICVIFRQIKNVSSFAWHDPCTDSFEFVWLNKSLTWLLFTFSRADSDFGEVDITQGGDYGNVDFDSQWVPNGV